jgi:anti-sigma-K factor RskA
MNDDGRGIETLRAAVEEVAVDIERRAVRRRRPTSWIPGLAVAAAVVAIALLIGSFWAPRPGSSEVEVIELRLHGREVRARIVEDAESGTIIVMPQPDGATSPAAVTVVIGGAR